MSKSKLVRSERTEEEIQCSGQCFNRNLGALKSGVTHCEDSLFLFLSTGPSAHLGSSSQQLREFGQPCLLLYDITSYSTKEVKAPRITAGSERQEANDEATQSTRSHPQFPQDTERRQKDRFLGVNELCWTHCALLSFTVHTSVEPKVERNYCH